MKNHVTSQPLSKKLCELGVPQKSEFYWNDGETFIRTGKHSFDGRYEKRTSIDKFIIKDEMMFSKGFPTSVMQNRGMSSYSAFLSSEIGEMLKNAKYSELWEAYQFHKGNTDGFGQIIIQSLSADFLSKMLAYLIENKIIYVKSL